MRVNPNKKAVFIGGALFNIKTAKKLDIDFINMSEYTMQSDEQDLECRSMARMVANKLLINYRMDFC